MTTTADERIIVALDVPRDEAIELADALVDRAVWVKIGMTLFYAQGPSIVAEMRERGLGVFLDLKLHDIPHQVRGAARSIGRLGAGMLTVHASGGLAMLEAAVEGAEEGAREAGLPLPAVLAVTVLTSSDGGVLRSVGVDAEPAAQVSRLAALARDAGVDGVVCSPQEASAMRELFGPTGLVVTPGIRPAWAGADDQARIATPAQAVASGASHLVIGRPITAASSPADAFDRIADELRGATS